MTREEQIQKLEEEFPGWRVWTSPNTTTEAGLDWHAVEASENAAFWELFLAPDALGPYDSADDLHSGIRTEIARQAREQA